MDVPTYFADIALELDRKSQAIRRDFASHRPSGGSNREGLVADVLRNYLPGAFEIDTGLIASAEGRFSNQADLIIVDRTWNAPLYPDGPNRIWLVEAVYALIEVKTSLSPSDVADAVAKCRNFKQLQRNFSDALSLPRSGESLFVIWSYESSAPETLKSTLAEALEAIPTAEQPDFVVVPGKLVAAGGRYREISVIGARGSQQRTDLERQYGSDLRGFKFDPLQVLECGKDSLFIWLVWILSWLKRAGPRNSELLAYLTKGKTWGRRV